MFITPKFSGYSPKESMYLTSSLPQPASIPYSLPNTKECPQKSKTRRYRISYLSNPSPHWWLTWWFIDWLLPASRERLYWKGVTHLEKPTLSCIQKEIDLDNERERIQDILIAYLLRIKYANSPLYRHLVRQMLPTESSTSSLLIRDDGKSFTRWYFFSVCMTFQKTHSTF